MLFEFRNNTNEGLSGFFFLEQEKLKKPPDNILLKEKNRWTEIHSEFWFPHGPLKLG